MCWNILNRYCLLCCPSYEHWPTRSLNSACLTLTRRWSEKSKSCEQGTRPRDSRYKKLLTRRRRGNRTFRQRADFSWSVLNSRCLGCCLQNSHQTNNNENSLMFLSMGIFVSDLALKWALVRCFLWKQLCQNTSNVCETSGFRNCSRKMWGGYIWVHVFALVEMTLSTLNFHDISVLSAVPRKRVVNAVAGLLTLLVL